MDTVALVAESLGTGAIACDETTAEVARLDQPLCVRQSWIIEAVAAGRFASYVRPQL